MTEADNQQSSEPSRTVFVCPAFDVPLIYSERLDAVMSLRAYAEATWRNRSRMDRWRLRVRRAADKWFCGRRWIS